jgi:hypothetical protein
MRLGSGIPDPGPEVKKHRIPDPDPQHCVRPEIYDTEITHDPLLLSTAQGIFELSTERLSRSTLHLKEGGEGSLYSWTL